MPVERSVYTFVGMPSHPDGSGYHRMFQPFKQMTDKSRHMIMIPPPGRQLPPPSPEDLEEVDLIAMQRPVGAAGIRAFELMQGKVARVYEIDDDLLRVDPSSLAHLADKRLSDSIKYMISRAELVTVSSPYLADFLAQFNPNVTVLQNVVNEALLSVQRPRRERVTVGWAGGSSHLVDMCAVQDPLREFLDAHPQVDMHYIGVDYSPLVHRECLWSPWSDNVWDYYRKIDFDIGIAPLADIPFNYSKSHLKALDFGALGIPVVATDLPPYREFVIDGESGFLVSKPEQWAARLRDLASDADMREEMGRRAREVASQWTIQRHWQDWEAAYESAVSGR